MSVLAVAASPIFELGAAVGLGISLFVTPYERARQRVSDRIAAISRVAEGLGGELNVRAAEVARDYRRAVRKGENLSFLSSMISLLFAFINIVFVLFLISNQDLIVSVYFPYFAFGLNLISYLGLVVFTREVSRKIFSSINDSLDNILKLK